MFEEITKQPIMVFSGAGASAALKLRTTAELDKHLADARHVASGKGRRIDDLKEIKAAARSYFNKQNDEPLDLEEYISFLHSFLHFFLNCAKVKSGINSSSFICKHYSLKDNIIFHPIP